MCVCVGAKAVRLDQGWRGSFLDALSCVDLAGSSVCDMSSHSTQDEERSLAQEAGNRKYGGIIPVRSMQTLTYRDM